MIVINSPFMFIFLFLCGIDLCCGCSLISESIHCFLPCQSSSLSSALHLLLLLPFLPLIFWKPSFCIRNCSRIVFVEILRISYSLLLLLLYFLLTHLHLLRKIYVFLKVLNHIHISNSLIIKRIYKFRSLIQFPLLQA